MFLIKLLRKFGKIIRGGAGGRELFLGAFLGVVLGMTPGFNLTSLTLLLLILILNCTMSVTMMGFALGKLLCLLLAPFTFHLGFFMIHQMGLEGFVRWAADAPVLTFLNLHVYCLMGGILPALVLAVIFGRLATYVVMQLRRAFAGSAVKYSWIKNLSDKKWMQLFLRLTFGPKLKEEEKPKKRPLLRKAGVVLALCMLLVGIAVEFLFLDAAVNAGIRRSLQGMVGAEVNVKEVDCSLFSGRLRVRGLQVTDPEQPEYNLFQADELQAKLSTSSLFSKRFIVDVMNIDRIQTHSKRETPGQVFRKPEKPEEVERPGRPLSDYIEKAKQIRQYLQRIKEYLDRHETDEEEKPVTPEKETVLANRKNAGYLGLSARDILVRHPLWVVRELRGDHVVLTGDLPPQTLKVENLSSHPGLHDKPVTVRVKPAEEQEETLNLVLHFEDPNLENTISARLRGLPVNSLESMTKVPVVVRGGKADILADGSFSKNSLALPFQIQVKNLDASAKSGEKILGLKTSEADALLQQLKEITIDGELAGSLTSPGLSIDYEGLQNSIKQQTGTAIKNLLREKAESKTEELKKDATKKLEDKLKDLF